MADQIRINRDDLPVIHLICKKHPLTRTEVEIEALNTCLRNVRFFQQLGTFNILNSIFGPAPFLTFSGFFYIKIGRFPRFP